MTSRAELSDGWLLRLADAHDPTVQALVPPEVRAALPVPATVPGSVHTDLLAAGLIRDPYLDLVEVEVDWIGRVAWEYERELVLDPAQGTRAALLFEGLDTVATVSVDGAVVARTANMHRRYEVPLADVTERTTRRLTVRFESAWVAGEAERARLGDLPAQYPGPFNFLRKMACNFGWDWGPVLVTAGIWRPVTLLQHDGARLVEVRPTTTVDGTRGTASFDVHATCAEGPLLVEATVGSTTRTLMLDPCTGTSTVEVHLEDPALWWPRGFGEPALHDARVRLLDAAGHPIDEWAERLGFRTVRLDTTPDEGGSAFSLVVNDVPVPVRGANWIPDDCFPSRVTAQRVRDRVRQATDANLNLLRVWGGGVYESRDFYRTCDEEGVLVWQDFLFACAAYPEAEPLLGEVEAEARDNVARLMPHPSLVLWNGNNENFWGYLDWDWAPRIGDRAWGSGYYLDVLPRAVEETDPSRPYWPGSPWSGSIERHPNDPDHGTIHVWDVWNEADYTVYRDYRPRFAAEFGWQAPPTWSTLTRAVHDDPLTPTSPGVLHHQRADDGNGKLERGLEPHFPAPRDVEDWHFATQLNQARALRVGVEHFRSWGPRCSGTIVWQLNDCWPVTSWSAVDGDGRKKPLWYGLRAANAPRLLTVQPRDGSLALVAVNDELLPWREEVVVRRTSFDGSVLAEHTLLLDVPGVGVATTPLPASVATPDDPHAELVVAGDALWFFAPDRELAYEPARLDAAVERDGDEVLVTVTAHGLVRDLCLFPDRITPAAEVDDCAVTLLAGQSRTLRVTGVPVGREDELLGTHVLRTANDLVVTARVG